MASGQNSDDELLAMLQPLTAPNEFVFETTLPRFQDTSDEDDGEPMPGPAPPAPMDPMAPIAPMAPMEPMEPMEPNESGSSAIPHMNVHKEAEEDKENDEIEYESPVKAAMRSPAKPSARNRRKSAPNQKGGDESGYESAAELLKSLARSSSKSQGRSKLNRKEAKREEVDYEVSDESPVKAARRRSQPAVEVSTEEPESKRKVLNFDVVIRPLLPQAAQEYTLIPPGDEVYRVLEVIKTGVPGEAWLSVEFEDGRIDQVSANLCCGILSKPVVAFIKGFRIPKWEGSVYLQSLLPRRRTVVAPFGQPPYFTPFIAQNYRCSSHTFTPSQTSHLKTTSTNKPSYTPFELNL